jgi:hypothetical protein
MCIRKYESIHSVPWYGDFTSPTCVLKVRRAALDRRCGVINRVTIALADALDQDITSVQQVSWFERQVPRDIMRAIDKFETTCEIYPDTK